MSTLRQTVRDLMVRIHLIAPTLAAYHVAQMSEEDITLQFQMYERLKLLTQTESETLRISEGVLS